MLAGHEHVRLDGQMAHQAGDVLGRAVPLAQARPMPRAAPVTGAVLIMGLAVLQETAWSRA